MITTTRAAILTLGLAIAGFTLPAAAVKDCTTEPMDKWMPPEKIEAMLKEQGYEVRKVKVEGTCLEAYATKDGRKAEIYMDPVTGKIVRIKEK